MPSGNRVKIALALAATGFSLRGAAEPAAKSQPTSCVSPQSPRSLTPSDWIATSGFSTVQQRSADTIWYTARTGVQPVLLSRCSQHYHCYIENFQGCPGQTPPPPVERQTCSQAPVVGSWVEIHTVYHAGPLRSPTPEGTELCTDGPLVVVAYQARVTSASTPPVELHFGPELAEWSGSVTNVEPEPQCKPAAYWSFTLGCNFTVSAAQLARQLPSPKKARELQPHDRLSHDLTHVLRAKHS